jgi:hypothetical protein
VIAQKFDERIVAAGFISWNDFGMKYEIAGMSCVISSRRATLCDVSACILLLCGLGIVKEYAFVEPENGGHRRTGPAGRV